VLRKAAAYKRTGLDSGSVVRNLYLWSLQWWSIRALKLLTVGAETTDSGRPFQLLTTRLVKKCCLTDLVALILSSLRLCPLVLSVIGSVVLCSGRNSRGNWMLSCRIWYTIIMSPLQGSKFPVVRRPGASKMSAGPLTCLFHWPAGPVKKSLVRQTFI